MVDRPGQGLLPAPCTVVRVINLAYDDKGTGEPVVFIAGRGKAEDTAKQIERAATNERQRVDTVIAVDGVAGRQGAARSDDRERNSGFTWAQRWARKGPIAPSLRSARQQEDRGQQQSESAASW